MSLLNFRTDHRVSADNMFELEIKKTAIIDDVSCSHLPEQNNMPLVFIHSSIVNGFLDSLIEIHC